MEADREMTEMIAWGRSLGGRLPDVTEIPDPILSRCEEAWLESWDGPAADRAAEATLCLLGMIAVSESHGEILREFDFTPEAERSVERAAGHVGLVMTLERMRREGWVVVRWPSPFPRMEEPIALEFTEAGLRALDL